MEPIERSPSSWRLPDTAAFHAWVTREFSYSRDDAKQLMVQQRFVRDFLQRASPYRGLLLYHGLGSGKTCTAIAASASDHIGRGKLFVMLPASLRSNYVKELRKCGGRRVRETQSWMKIGSDWVPADGDNGTPFDRLPAPDRQDVRRQLNERIDKEVKFVNYNGLNTKRVNELCHQPSGSNPFDDAVVVVDEVHNFVSSVSNGGLLARVYDRLMEASRCKILLLSGTPLVNEPHELALLVNLAGGFLTTHEFTLRGGLDARTSSQLNACPAVHTFRDTVGRTGHPVVEIRLVPDGFLRTEGQMVKMADGGTDGIKMVREILSFGPGIIGNARRRQTTLLPADPEVFRRLFVTDDFDIANADILARRMSGTVSFFKGHDKSLYPRLRSMLLVRTVMSARQFSEYTIQRTIEVKREEKARIMAGMRKRAVGKSAAVDGVAGYRPLSRAVCNFAFPDDVPRPQRKGGRGGEAVDGDEDANDSYERALDEAAQKLRANSAALTVGAGLTELSPKFNAIVEHLMLGNTTRTAIRADDADAPVDAPRPSTRRRLKGELHGTAIVYSERRRAEGINLLAAALDVNGFCEFALVRNVDGELEVAPSVAPDKPRYILYNNDDPAVAACMLSVFNNQMDDVPETVLRGIRRLNLNTNLRGEIVRALLITKSGAEGITTRNVREVHVVEPFWHANRIEQVVGRARRAYSHDDLPPADRTVDVFIYMATFDAEQAKVHKKDDVRRVRPQCVAAQTQGAPAAVPPDEVSIRRLRPVRRRRGRIVHHASA